VSGSEGKRAGGFLTVTNVKWGAGGVLKGFSGISSGSAVGAKRGEQ